MNWRPKRGLDPDASAVGAPPDKQDASPARAAACGMGLRAPETVPGAAEAEGPSLTVLAAAGSVRPGNLRQHPENAQFAPGHGLHGGTPAIPPFPAGPPFLKFRMLLNGVAPRRRRKPWRRRPCSRFDERG